MAISEGKPRFTCELLLFLVRRSMLDAAVMALVEEQVKMNDCGDT